MTTAHSDRLPRQTIQLSLSQRAGLAGQENKACRPASAQLALPLDRKTDSKLDAAEAELDRREGANPLWLAFLAFHHANLHLWSYFVRVTFFKMRDEHYSKWAARGPVFDLRWNPKLAHLRKQISRRGRYGINDHHSAYYARLFRLRYPAHEDFYEIRGEGRTAR